MEITRKKTHGGKRDGSGRKSREEKGQPPVVATTVKVEKEVIVICREKYGSLAEALRFAAKNHYQADR